MEKDYNFFDQLYASQKEMIDSWSKTLQDFGGSYGAPFNVKNPMETYEKFIGSMKDSPFFSYRGDPSEVLNKIKQGSEVYYKIYDLYKEIYDKNFKPTQERMKKILDDYEKNVRNYMGTYVSAYLPKEVQEMFDNAYEIKDAYEKTMTSFYGPWADTIKKMTDSYVEGTFKDPEGFLKYFDEWKENYNKTFGKLLNMPMVGISRKTQEERLQTLDKYIRFITYTAELTVKLQTIVNETTQNVIKDSFKLLEEGQAPKTFDEFYDFWKTSLSNNFDKVFYSTEFSKFLGNFVDSVLTLKIQMDKVIEDSLKYMPVPTNKDMDSLYKTVHELKTEIRKMRREFREHKDESELDKEPKADK